MRLSIVLFLTIFLLSSSFGSTTSPNCAILLRIKRNHIDREARERTASEIAALSAQDERQSIALQAERFSLALEKILPDALAATLRESGVKPKEVASSLENFNALPVEAQLEVIDKTFEKLSYLLRSPTDIAQGKKISELAKKYGLESGDIQYLSKEFEGLSGDEIQDLKLAIGLQIIEDRQTKDDVTSKFTLLNRLKLWLGLEQAPVASSRNYSGLSLNNLKDRVSSNLSSNQKEELRDYLNHTSIYQIGEYVRANLKNLSKEEIEEILKFLQLKELKDSELFQILEAEIITLRDFEIQSKGFETLVQKIQDSSFGIDVTSDQIPSAVSIDVNKKILELSFKTESLRAEIQGIEALRRRREESLKSKIPNEVLIRDLNSLFRDNQKLGPTSEMFLEKCREFLKARKGSLSSSQMAMFFSELLRNYNSKVHWRDKNYTQIQKILQLFKENIEENKFVFSEEELSTYFNSLSLADDRTGHTHKDWMKFEKFSKELEADKKVNISDEIKRTEALIGELDRIKKDLISYEEALEGKSPPRAKKEKRL